jgi:hypothetical protein
MEDEPGLQVGQRAAQRDEQRPAQRATRAGRAGDGLSYNGTRWLSSTSKAAGRRATASDELRNAPSSGPTPEGRRGRSGYAGLHVSLEKRTMGRARQRTARRGHATSHTSITVGYNEPSASWLGCVKLCRATTSSMCCMATSIGHGPGTGCRLCPSNGHGRKGRDRVRDQAARGIWTRRGAISDEPHVELCTLSSSGPRDEQRARTSCDELRRATSQDDPQDKPSAAVCQAMGCEP